MPDQPITSRRPIVIAHETADGWRISSWAPPSGIWRRIGEDQICRDLDHARQLSAVLSFTTGAIIALDPTPFSAKGAA
ncbi:hypothetical protein [Novosphingobium sp.]|uniref:hypothetical protein n=1 Tax=Novosphingobium sp. TaxID=1874826 RepID=UPI0035B368B1